MSEEKEKEEGGGEGGEELDEMDDGIEILGIEDEGEEGEGEGEGESGKEKEAGEGDINKGDAGKEEGGKEATGKEPTFKELLEEAKEEIRGETKKGEDKGPQTPTLEELDEAEDKLELMLDNEEIDRLTYRKYMRNIAKIRKGMEEEALVLNLEAKRTRKSAEENLSSWAQTNAPEFLDVRKKETKDAVEWAKDYLGAEQKGDMWIVPKKVGQIVFGVLYRGNQSAKEGEGGKDKGYEKGVKDAQKRDAELRNRDTRVPKGGKKEDATSPATADEREVMERLGLKDLKAYRRMKKMSGSKMATVQVG